MSKSKKEAQKKKEELRAAIYELSQKIEKGQASPFKGKWRKDLEALRFELNQLN